MANANFIRRKPDPDSNFRLSLDGTDVHYQMVPSGGSRGSSVQISGGAVQIAVVKPDIATVFFPSSRDFARFDSVAQLQVDFTVTGLKEGKTEIVAEDATGQRLDHILVSVKETRVLTYNLVKLEDVFRKCPTTDTDLLAIMQLVQGYFLNQANVILSRSSLRQLGRHRRADREL